MWPPDIGSSRVPICLQDFQQLFLFTVYPSSLRMLATASQQEPSAKAPCTITTFLIVIAILLFSFCFFSHNHSEGGLEHCVGVVRGGCHRLQHVPVLDHLAVRVETEDIDTRGFLAGPVQVTYVYKGQIAIDGEAFDLAGYASRLLDVAHDGIEPIREKRVVLDIWPAQEIGIQVGLAQVENLRVDCVKRLLDALSCHASPFRFPSASHQQFFP